MRLKMVGVVVLVVSTCFVLSSAVTPLTAEELHQIRDFTNKAHMKRMHVYPDQIMTASHYLGRRLPADKPPAIYMQVPQALAPGGKPVFPVSLEAQPQQQVPQQGQQGGGVQNPFVVNYAPVASNTVPQQAVPQQGQVIQNQQPVQAAAGQQGGQPQQQVAYQFVPLQNPNGQRPPPPQKPFFGLGESGPSNSILNFFFPKRLRRPFRLPFRFEYGHVPANPNPALIQHQQNLHNVMAQQHLLSVQQAQAQQGQGVQPSANPVAAPSSTLSTTLNTAGAPTTGPSGVPSPSSPTLITAQSQAGIQVNQVPQQFHKEIQYYKPLAKPNPIQPPFAPHTLNGFIPQSRPNDGQHYLQKYVGGPHHHDFSFVPFGQPHVPPVIAGPTGKFPGPVSFSHIEQMPYRFNPQPLPLTMMVQNQEFPNYHFSTKFTSGGAAGNHIISHQAYPTATTPVQTTTVHIQPQDASAGVQSASVRQPQRIKKLRPRPTTTPVTTTTILPSSTSTQSLGDVIFESSKETREFHDTALLASPEVEVVRPRKPKQREVKTSSVESSSVVLAPLVFSKESSEPLVVTTSSTSSSSSSPLPFSSTSVTVSTVATTTQSPFKEKITKKDYHHKKQQSEKKVTASGAGLGAVTVEPLRVTSTSGSTASTSRSTPGRVVTTSVTSRVVSVGPHSPSKRLRLRKVKVPNPDAKGHQRTTATSTSSTTSQGTSSTTPFSTRLPSRSTSTTAIYSSTESSVTTEA